MKVKKILSMLLASVTALGLLAGCSANTNDTQNSSTDAASGSGNVLVVYYSATGNTEEVANYIADSTGGDLFEVEPAEPYTDDDLNWTDDNSRVSQEYADESLRDMELVTTEVENNDFTGKTVIPFCTSSSSGIGDSGTLLADLAGTGDWQEGMRFRSGVDEADVQNWVNGLGL